MGLIDQIVNWLLYARINYWGSHWSANVFIAIPVVFIFIKVTKDRWTKDRQWWKRGFWVFLDVFMIGTFTPSFHEVMFEPVLVLIRVIQIPANLSALEFAWNHNVQVWQSFFVMFTWDAILGFALYYHQMKFRLKWWLPFLVVFGVWSVSGLQVSLPFVNDQTWCHDCLWPNLSEFLYNLTYAVAIMGTFGVYSLFSGFPEKFKLFLKSQKKTVWDSNPFTSDD